MFQKINFPCFVLSLAAIALSACVPPPPAQKIAPAAAGPRIKLASQSGDFQSPLDSIPDPTGQTIYFTAENAKGKGLFQVATTGGTVSEVAVGAPFVAPSGIAIAPDGQHAFVADPAAGAIFSIALGKGVKPAPLAIVTTAGTAPQNLDVATEGGQTIIYYTGKDAQDGQPGVFKMNATGSDKPMLVYKGAPLTMPDGIAVAPDGTVYVADRAAAGNSMGQVFKIAGGKLSVLVPKVRTGNPAGIALTKDGAVLLVSALQPDGKSDQVLVVNTATGESNSVTDVVGQNSAAGGVHRAYNSNLFSWADRTCRPKGCVFSVEP